MSQCCPIVNYFSIFSHINPCHGLCYNMYPVAERSVSSQMFVLYNKRIDVYKWALISWKAFNTRPLLNFILHRGDGSILVFCPSHGLFRVMVVLQPRPVYFIGDIPDRHGLWNMKICYERLKMHQNQSIWKILKWTVLFHSYSRWEIGLQIGLSHLNTSIWSK